MKFLLVLLLTPGICLAVDDIFAFKDLAGFEKCMNQDHLVSGVKTEDGSQHRFLSQVEIQQECLKKAGKLFSSPKDKAKLTEFVKMTKRTTAHENALGLIQLLVKLDRPSCNQMEIYEVMTKGLSHPKDYPSVTYSYYEEAKKAIRTCLKDKEFKKDFLEEKDSSNSYVAENACSILVEEKLVKTCPKKG